MKEAKVTNKIKNEISECLRNFFFEKITNDLISEIKEAVISHLVYRKIEEENISVDVYFEEYVDNGTGTVIVIYEKVKINEDVSRIVEHRFMIKNAQINIF